MIDKLLYYDFEDIIFSEDNIPTVESGDISEVNRNKFIISNRDGYLGIHAGMMSSKKFPVENKNNNIVQAQQDTNIYSPFIFNINKDFHMCRIIGAPYNGQHAGIGLQILSPDLMLSIVKTQDNDSLIGDISLSIKFNSLGIHNKRDIFKLKKVFIHSNAVDMLLNKKEFKASIENGLDNPVLKNSSLEPIGEYGGSLVFFSSGQWNTFISNKTDAIFSNYFDMSLKQFEDFLDMVAYIPWEESIQEKVEEVRFIITYNNDKSMFYLEPVFAMPVQSKNPIQRIKVLRNKSLIVPAGINKSNFQIMSIYDQHFNRNFNNQKLLPVYRINYIRNWLRLVRSISPNPNNTFITFRTPEQLINPVHMVAHYYDDRADTNIAISDIVAIITRYFIQIDYEGSNDVIIIKD
jgi:hypothetical protein